MIIDQSKVIKLPKDVSPSDTIEYICGCETCASRNETMAAEHSLLNDTLQQVEEALQNTPLIRKEISLQFMNRSHEFRNITFESLNEFIVRLVSTEVSFAQALLAYVKFSHQFNKKYRQPLICMLHDRNIRIIENLSRTSHSSEYSSILSRINSQLAFLRDQEEILKEIQIENFISERNTSGLLIKTQKAITELTGKARKVMEAHYTQMSHNDLPQNLIVVKATQKMA